MTHSLLAVLLLVGTHFAGGRAQPMPMCNGQVYSSNYNCINGMYLCMTGQCACPYVSPSTVAGGASFDCFTPGQYSCPSPPPTSTTGSGLAPKGGNTRRALCPAGTSADPLMESFTGCKWYLKGKADTVMNLISETNHVVNTQLVAANLLDEHHGGDGTFHGAISVRFQNTLATARVDAQGNLTVQLDGNAVPFEAVREHQGMMVNVRRYYPYFGQVAEIVTPDFRFFLHAVQPYDSPAGWNRGHLDFSATALATTLNMHGLLGQGSNQTQSLCNDDFNFHGDGKEEDYVLPSLDSVAFTYNLFNPVKSSRRRLAEYQMGSDLAGKETMTAGSAAMLKHP